MASLSRDLYDLYKKAEGQETFANFQKTEYTCCTKERDELLCLVLKLIKEGKYTPSPEEMVGHCRCCDTPMGMKPWNDQYCSYCMR